MPPIEAAAGPSVEEMRLMFDAAMVEPIPETLEVKVDAADMAFAKLESDGGLEGHKNKYKGNIADCPFLASMGSAGIELAEKWEASAKDPNRGKTIAEILAEQMAPKEKSVAEPETVKEDVKADPKMREALELTVPFVLPEQAAQQPVEALLQPVVKPESRKEPNVEPVVVDADVAQAHIFEESLLVTEEESSQTVIPVSEKNVPFILEVAPLEVKEAILPATVVDEAPVEVAPVQTEQALTFVVPDIKSTYVDEVFVRVIPTLKLPVEAPVKQSLVVKVAEEFSLSEEVKEAETFDVSSQATPLVAASTEQLETFEVIMADWISTDVLEELEADFQELDEQQAIDHKMFVPFILDTNLEAAKDITSDEEITEVTAIETKEKVFKALEAMTEVYAQFKEAGVEPTAETVLRRLEPLCKQLFESIGIRPSDAVIAAVVKDIVAKLSFDELNNRGTSEHRHSIATTLQDYFIKMLQDRFARFAGMSRYIITRTPLLAQT